MKPVICKISVISALALGNLIFMMWKNQILSTTMNIKRVPKIFLCHRTTFYMPPRTSFTPRRYPKWLSVFFLFPKCKIHRIFLYFWYINPSPKFQLLNFLIRQFPIILILLHLKINIPIFLISKPIINQFLNNLNNFLHILSNLRSFHTFKNIQPVNIFKKTLYIFFWNFTCRNSFFNWFVYNLIIHIRKILHIINFHPFIFKISCQRIKNHNWTCISQMYVIIDSRSANIHFYLIFFYCLKFFNFICHCIVKFHFLFSLLLKTFNLF